MTTMTVAVAQFVSQPEPAANVATMCESVRDAAARGADIVAFHELATTEYFCYEHENTDRFDLAETVPGPSTSALAEVSAELGISVVLPLYEVSDGVRYNTVVYLDVNGAVATKYRKVHVPHTGDHGDQRGADEAFYFAGSDLGFPMWRRRDGINVGSLICFDRHFPEAAREYALAGAQVIFVPTASYRRFIVEEIWEAELKAMAFQNCVYVVGINKVGPVLGESVPAGSTYPGRSIIVDPEGRTLATCDDRPCLITAEIDASFAESIRDGALHLLEGRRPDQYTRIALSTGAGSGSPR